LSFCTICVAIAIANFDVEFVKEGEFLDSIKNALKHHPKHMSIDIKPAKEATNDLKDADLDTLHSWYEKLVSPKFNFLYECKYHQPFSAMEEMADIAGFYRAFGVTVRGERVDHISMELEFMRLLALKESKALIDREMENRDICISAQKKFLFSHLGRWTLSIVNMTEEVRFYNPLSRFLHTWISAECEYFSVKPEKIFYSFTEDTGEEENEFCYKGGSII
ncbi:MAG: hypothetical protein D6828_02995, partial [Nitrospirae bacterium]